MIDWTTLEVYTWWPLVLAALAALALGRVWLRRRGVLFPDLSLLTATAPRAGWVDRLPAILGGMAAGLLTLALLQPSVVRSMTVSKQARDFLLVVDTSGSMRERTAVPRVAQNLHFRPDIGPPSPAGDASSLPTLARYEVARESVMGFLERRSAQDRVALVYFNHEVYLMAGFTTDLEFIKAQLAAMEPYVHGGTELARAVQAALNLLRRSPHKNRRALLLLTDAEVFYTSELQRQFERIRDLDVALYLLWIAPGSPASGWTRAFLDLAGSLGEVFPVQEIGAASLSAALGVVDRLEAYTYPELRTERVNLSRPLVQAARWLVLAWVLLVATVYHPGRREALTYDQ